MVAADRLSTTLTAVISSVAGADGLAVDGIVDETEFARFATKVVEVAGLTAVAWIERIDGSERLAWERSTGLPMKDTDGEGGFVRAARRSLHAVVSRVEPVTDDSRSVLGFDIMSDEVRAGGVRRADDLDVATLVGPIRLARGGASGVFLLRAVRDTDEQVVGYLASGISLDAIVEQIEAIPDVGRISVSVDGMPIRQASDGDASTSFELAGRVFTVVTGDEGSVDVLLPLSLGTVSMLFTGVAAVAGRRSLDGRRRARRASMRSVAIAELTEALADVTTTSGVVDTLLLRAGQIVDARHVNVARRLADDPEKLDVAHGDQMSPHLAARFALQDLGAELPLPETVRTGVMTTIPDRAAYCSRYPEVMDEVIAAGIHSICCVPLSLGTGRSVGAVGFAFERVMRPTERDEIETSASWIGQLAGRAYDRALTREIVQQRVDLLSEFARALTTVRTSADVASCVVRLMPPLLDVARADIVVDDVTWLDVPSTEVRSYDTGAPGGERLTLRVPEARPWSAIDETLTITVADLVGGALTRTRLHDQEQAVLQRLQHSLLAPPPVIDGYDLAVGYRSALETVGMGGDWYTVIDSAESIHVVVGDVAGHGPGAVALMAEVKTVMRHVLTNGATLGEAVSQADRTLRRRHAYASGCVLRVDKDSHRLTYVNAGHVPPVMRTAHELAVLPEVHRPWLGVERRSSIASSEVALAVDDVLIVYTDGLVEERGEVIDESIARRFHRVGRGRFAEDIVDDLIAEREASRTERSVDDDIAVVVIRRLGARAATPIGRSAT